MDSEQHHYELRSRSRSRSHTPMIFNQLMTDSELEHHYDLRSRESRERSQTPSEVTSSRRSGSRSLPAAGAKARDSSMDTISETREELQAERMEKDTLASATIKRVERRSERQRVKRQSLTNGQGEVNDLQSVDKSSQKRKSLTPKRTITSDYSSEEGDAPSRPASAYEIYKQAGDYWNVFPKTDYTYSPASQCRYEIAPGVLAMPNMSRPSIHSDGSSAGSTLSLSQQNASQSSISTREGHTDYFGEINESIEQNRLNEENARLLATMNSDTSPSIGYKKVHVEQVTRRRVYYGGSSNRPEFDRLAQVDSDAELDEAIGTKYQSRGERWRVRKVYESVVSLVTTLFFSVVHFVSSKILRRDAQLNTSQTYSQYGVSESKWTRIWSRLDHYLQYLYLWLIKVLYLDTWILSRFSRIRERIIARPSRLLWLILLPPLLLAGFWALPSTENLTFSRFGGDVPVEISNRESLNEELRRAITVLVNRVEKLEAAGSQQGERFTNITESLEGLKRDETNIWAQYNQKLSTLQEDLTSTKSDDTTRNELASIKLEFANLRSLYLQQKDCCDKSPPPISTSTIETHVQEVVTSYLGAFRSDITNLVEETVRASLPADLSTATSEKMSSTECPPADQLAPLAPLPVSDDYIRSIVKEVLKIYDADKTGRVDYALESAGGQIISIRCTQRHNVNTRAYKVLGFTLYYESGDPRTVIQGHPLQPGVCWAFQDFPGYLLIKVRAPIRVTGFTMEHAPRSILPNNEMKSAPRRFNVWGLKEENDASPVSFGEFEFESSDDSLQYFPVKNSVEGGFEYIELRIHSNHGQLEYTCLYRFRIHGVPV